MKSILILSLLAFPSILIADDQGGYLFAHMMKQDYGRLYYSVSKDALHWTMLNEGKRVNEAYRGHPDICLGHDGKYYMTGGSKSITLWVSQDLVKWEKFAELEPDVYKIPEFKPAEKTYGASKIYFDQSTSQYLVTWHTSMNDKLKEKPEHYWAGQRTLYITSKELKEFSEPRRLFLWDMATIDVIVRRIDDTYYAVIKDELYPSFVWPTGKTIRVASSKNLTGPWTEPSAPITPNFREAPTLIPDPEGTAWYLYYEQYPGVSYGLSIAQRPAGPWHNVYWQNYNVPEGIRHGCIIPISEKAYTAVIAAYGVIVEAK